MPEKTLTHWKKLAHPDYLGAYALEAGKDMVLTIKICKNELVTGTDGKKEECTILYFSEAVKPMILNKTNAKSISKIHKTPYIEEWTGKKIQLFVTEVKAFGEVTDCLRIRPFVPATDVPQKSSVSLEQLKVVYELKKDALTDTERTRAEQIINGNEVKSFEKLHNILKEK